MQDQILAKDFCFIRPSFPGESPGKEVIPRRFAREGGHSSAIRQGRGHSSAIRQGRRSFLGESPGKGSFLGDSPGKEVIPRRIAREGGHSSANRQGRGHSSANCQERGHSLAIRQGRRSFLGDSPGKEVVPRRIAMERKKAIV